MSEINYGISAINQKRLAHQFGDDQYLLGQIIVTKECRHMC